MKRIAVALSLVALGLPACGGDDDGGGGGNSFALCALFSACGFLEDANFGQACSMLSVEGSGASASLSTDAKVLAAAFACGKAATTCGELNACIKATPTEAASCTGDTDVCVEGRLIECEAGSTTPDAFDCEGVGLVCGQNASGAGCGTAACDQATATPSCDGSMMVECEEGGVVTKSDCRSHLRISCGGSPMTCRTQVGDTCAIVDGEALCTGAGDACDTETYANTCEGSVMVTCANGKVGRRDCKALDSRLTCGVAPDLGYVDCVPSATACTTETPEACAEGVITYCLMGTVATLDCKAYGMSGCTTTTGENGVVARCTE